MPIGAQEVKFKRGQSSTMPSDLEAGSLLVQTDTGDVFLDNTDSDRIQLGDSRKLSLSGGTMTGPINMGSQKITNLGNPTENTDAANKIFVDTAFQELESAINQELLTYLPLKGGTMVGAIDMGDYKITSLATPTDGTDAANKTYVDNTISELKTSKLDKVNAVISFTGAFTAQADMQNGPAEVEVSSIDGSKISGPVPESTHATAADSATQDANGNNIADTYATKNEVAAKSIKWEIFE